MIYSGHFTVWYTTPWLSLGVFCRSCLSFSPLSEQVYTTQAWFSCQWSPEPQRWQGSSSCCQNWSFQADSNHRQFWAKPISTELVRESKKESWSHKSSKQRSWDPGITSSQQPKIFPLGYTAFCVCRNESHFGTVVDNLVALLTAHQLVQTSHAVWKWFIVWIMTTNHFNRYTRVYN